MDRNEAAAELRHFRAADRCLQPLPVMERRVPVVDGSMIPAEREFEAVVRVVTDDQALHFGIETRGGRGARACIGARRQAQFPEYRNLRRKSAAQVQDKLALLETRVRLQQRLRSETGSGCL